MTLAWWQRLLLLIVLLSGGITFTELLLLEHIEEWQQLIPVVLLAIVLVVTLLVLFTQQRWAVLLFRSVLAVCLASALLGLYFHYQANVEFVHERHPGMRGFELFKRAMMGGMPALAPGAMAQLALLGWLATFSRRSA